MSRKSCRTVALLLILTGTPALPMTLKEFRKFPSGEQGTYLGAAVSMLAYSYAANGNVPKARCIQKWFFGERKGTEPPGVREIAIEAGVAANIDAEKHHIEGIVMGAADRACGMDSPRTASKP